MGLILGLPRACPSSASCLAGTPVPRSLPEAAAQAGVEVLLLAGNHGVAAAAAGRSRLGSDLQNVESYCPPFGDEDDPEELGRIKEAHQGARLALVLVGLGFPKLERLISSRRSEMPQTWFVGWGYRSASSRGSSRERPRRFSASVRSSR